MEGILDFLGVFGVVLIGALLIIVGYIGSVMPALPGAPVAMLAVLLLHFTKIYVYPWWLLAIAIVLAIGISFVDYVVPVMGTKKFGGSKAGVRGSTIGLIAGVLISFFTAGMGIALVLLGPFIGAYVGERFFAKADSKTALRSAWGSLVGFLAGTMGKLIVTFILSIIFVIGVIKGAF